MIAFLWIDFSQQINHVAKTSRALILITILMLLFVVLVPFSTSLFNDYPKNISASAVFNLNMLFAIGIQTIFWLYSAKNNLISEENKKHVNEITKYIVFLPIVPALALVVGLIKPGWSNLVYLIIPILLFLPRTKN